MRWVKPAVVGFLCGNAYFAYRVTRQTLNIQERMNRSDQYSLEGRQ